MSSMFYKYSEIIFYVSYCRISAPLIVAGQQEDDKLYYLEYLACVSSNSTHSRL
jgi:hypothetical protein